MIFMIFPRTELGVAEVEVLCFSLGVTRMHQMRNESIRGPLPPHRDGRRPRRERGREKDDQVGRVREELQTLIYGWSGIGWC